jgi:hypothetical protein
VSAPQFLKAYEDMVLAHQADFDRFAQIHANFSQDQQKYKAEFDQEGKLIQRFVYDAESRLVRKMENSGKSKFADNVSDKFRTVVKAHFPLFDLIGVIIE